ncbi:hypothetical protein V6N13_125786 [Hibiscus sabdariffa]|uniref:Uncharacterized protein n=1 Tax=Hibiscus sabdariffa TaxID=183260 RepID=A0ABR2U6N4_9ROSI
MSCFLTWKEPQTSLLHQSRWLKCKRREEEGEGEEDCDAFSASSVPVPSLRLYLFQAGCFLLLGSGVSIV